MSRKRTLIDIKDKLKAVNQVENGVKIKCVAAHYSVGLSTVSGWIKDKDRIVELCSKIPNRKTMKTSDFDKLNETLFSWFSQQRKKGVRLSGPVLQEKARLLLAEMLGESGMNFVANSGWLDRFKSRYGIRQQDLCAEEITIDDNSHDGPSNSTDDTDLKLKILPTISLVKEKNAPKCSKVIKRRTSTRATAKTSGKLGLPLLCVGKAESAVEKADDASNQMASDRVTADDAVNAPEVTQHVRCYDRSISLFVCHC